jgi:hypothetical protein
MGVFMSLSISAGLNARSSSMNGWCHIKQHAELAFTEYGRSNEYKTGEIRFTGTN